LPHEGELLTTSLDAEGRRKLRASHESDATIRYDAFASSEPPSSISPSQLAEVASSPAELATLPYEPHPRQVGVAPSRLAHPKPSPPTPRRVASSAPTLFASQLRRCLEETEGPQILTTQDVLEHEASGDCGTPWAWRLGGCPPPPSGDSTMRYEGDLLAAALVADGGEELRLAPALESEGDATIQYEAWAGSCTAEAAAAQDEPSLLPLTPLTISRPPLTVAASWPTDQATISDEPLRPQVAAALEVLGVGTAAAATVGSGVHGSTTAALAASSTQSLATRVVAKTPQKVSRRAADQTAALAVLHRGGGMPLPQRPPCALGTENLSPNAPPRMVRSCTSVAVAATESSQWLAPMKRRKLERAPAATTPQKAFLAVESGAALPQRSRCSPACRSAAMLQVTGIRKQITLAEAWRTRPIIVPDSDSPASPGRAAHAHKLQRPRRSV